MLAVLMFLMVQDPFAKARADIDGYCRGKGRQCVQTQRAQMGHFVTMMAGFRDRGGPANCMKAAKRGRHVDWVVASACLRAKVRGRALGS